MGTEIRYTKDRDGNRIMRPFWYGRYTSPDGRETTINLGVKIQGNKGTQTFKRSRDAARESLAKIQAEIAKGRQTRTAGLRVFKDSTGTELRDATLAELSGLVDGRATSARWAGSKRKWVADFVAWANRRGLFHVLDVTEKDAQAYLEERYAGGAGGCTAETVGKIRASLGMAFGAALPSGEPNPWKAGGVGVKRAEGDAQYHRTPLTEEEVETLLDAAREDPMAHDLITCGLCTALRRGDVCRLRWSGVDLMAGSIQVRTHKTGAVVYLPIFEALRDVLERRLAEREEGAEYVFPEAAKLIETNPDAITWRVKKVFARAFFNPAEAAIVDADRPERANLADVLDKVAGAVRAAQMAEEKRAKMLELLTRYAGGASYRAIEAETGISRGGISGLLHEAEGLAGVAFLTDRRAAFSVKRAVAELTRAARGVGARAASVRDFHSLRTSFVTLAIKHGVPVEKITAITGHATVETALRFYAQTKGTDFREDFEKAMPKALTKRRRPPKAITGEEAEKERAERLAALAETLRNLPAEDRVELARMMAGGRTITAAGK